MNLSLRASGDDVGKGAPARATDPCTRAAFRMFRSSPLPGCRGDRATAAKRPGMKIGAFLSMLLFVACAGMRIAAAAEAPSTYDTA